MCNRLCFLKGPLILPPTIHICVYFPPALSQGWPA